MRPRSTSSTIAHGATVLHVFVSGASVPIAIRAEEWSPSSRQGAGPNHVAFAMDAFSARLLPGERACFASLAGSDLILTVEWENNSLSTPKRSMFRCQLPSPFFVPGATPNWTPPSLGSSSLKELAVPTLPQWILTTRLLDPTEPAVPDLLPYIHESMPVALRHCALHKHAEVAEQQLADIDPPMTVFALRSFPASWLPLTTVTGAALFFGRSDSSGSEPTVAGGELRYSYDAATKTVSLVFLEDKKIVAELKAAAGPAVPPLRTRSRYQVLYLV